MKEILLIILFLTSSRRITEIPSLIVSIKIIINKIVFYKPNIYREYP